MREFRINTPGPSFLILAENIDAATCVAVTYLPTPKVVNGWQLTQRDIPRNDGRTLRSVCRWTKSGNLVTGFTIRETRVGVDAVVKGA